MRGTPFTFADFRGGLNSKDAPYLLEINQARDLLNVVSTSRGAVRKRNGMQTLASGLASQPLSLFPFEAVSPTVLIAQVAGTLQKITGAGAVTQIKSGLSSTARWEFVQAPAIAAQGPLYGMNGIDAAQQWDGVAGATSAWTPAAANNLPNGKYLQYLGNHVFVAGMSSYTPTGAGSPVSDAGSALVWSAPGDPTTWPATNVLLLDPGDGDHITGLGTVGPYLLVFKRRKAWVIFNLETGANRRLGKGVGCASHRSIVETPQGTFWLTEDQGVFRTNGSTVSQVSTIITPTINSFTAAQAMAAAGAFLANHYYLSLGSRTLDFDLQLESWWIHDTVVNDWAVWHPTSAAALYAASGGTTVDQAFVDGVFQDHAVNYDAHWATAWLSPDYFRRRIVTSPYFRKRIYQMRLEGTGVLDLYVAKDFAGGDTLIRPSIFTANRTTTFGDPTTTFGDPTTLFGDAGTVSEARIGNPGVARAFSFKFASTSPSVWELETMYLLTQDRTD